MSKIDELRLGFETAYIDGSVVSNNIYRPQFVSNNHKEGKKVLSSIEDELLVCDGFQISVAFITMNGITPLLQTLKELEKRNIKGEILTTNYLNFSEPKALKKLNELSNITLKMYDVEVANEGFHTKGYIFRKEEIYHIIIGSSNITSAALTDNREWNTKLVSTVHGETAKEIVTEFNELWNSNYALTFDEFYENYNERYKIIKHQREVAKQEEITSIEKYKLQPNSMQIGFIINLKKILEAGEDRALLISATGTGKTYASAFAMRELGFKRVLFLVHRGQLARQTKKSYEKVFAESVSMGLVGAGYHEYDADYIHAEGVLGKGLFDADYAMYLKSENVEIISEEASELLPLIAPLFNTTWEHYTGHLKAPSSEIRVGSAAVRKGNCIYFAHPLSMIYHVMGPKWVKQLLHNAIDVLMPDRLLEHTGPSTTIATVNEQTGKNRWIVHLMHYVPERRTEKYDIVEDIIPLYNIDLRVKTDRKPSTVRLVPQMKNLEFRYENRQVVVTIPKVEGHQMVEIQF